jgi:ABC-type branched-subunit amino acid transport system substrate-binding protein
MRNSKNARLLVAATLLAVSLSSHAQIKLGVSGPIEGSNAASMLELLKGAELYLDRVNETGGIAGQKVVLVARNDDFKVEKTVEVVKKLIEEDQVTALFLVRGTPHNQAILPLVEKHQVPLIAPSTGAIAFHEPVNKYVFNVRTAYQLEAEKLIALLQTIGIVRIAVLHVGDGFGRDVLVGLNRGFASAKLTPLVIREFDRDAATKDNQEFMKPVLGDVLQKDPQLVVVIGAGLAVKNAVVALRAAGSTTQIATVSNNASTGFIKLLDKYSAGVIVSQVFPNERNGSTAMVREARSIASAKQVTLTPAMMEGYAAAKVAVKGLQNAGKTPTRASLLKALDNLKEFDMGDVTIGYSPTDHTGMDTTDLSIITRGVFLR